jgi:hypothetical protein
MSVYFFCSVKLFFKRAADGFGLKRFDDFKYLRQGDDSLSYIFSTPVSAFSSN